MLHLNKAVPERRESEVNYDFLQIYNEDRRRDDGGGCRFLLLADGFSQEAVEVMGGASVPMAYEEALFDTNQVMRIDIQIERENGRQCWRMPLQKSITPVTCRSTTKNNMQCRSPHERQYKPLLDCKESRDRQIQSEAGI